MQKGKPYRAIVVEPGERYGQLTVVHEAERLYQPSGQYARSFMCKCECGNIKRVRLAHLRHGRVTSCGCNADPVHGLCGTPLHNSWRAMKMRCGWGGYSETRLYKARGIEVCKEWRDSFLEFAKWSRANGYAEGLTIDRIDSDGGYSPENCRWVTQGVNNSNRRCTVRVTYRGKEQPLTTALREHGLANHIASIRRRIARGWTADRAIDTPIRQGKYRRKAA